jgi:hypothetical protein
MYDMDIYATDAITEQMPGSGTADDLRRAVENIENDFDLDSYAPYHSQEIELINDFERDFVEDAVIQVNRSDAFGWAACTRIIGDEGEIYAFEAGQLDGSNGFSMRVVPGLWLSCAFDAKAAATDGGK